MRCLPPTSAASRSHTTMAPRLAWAQARRMFLVALFPGEEEDDQPAAQPFFDELRRRGWVEGTNIEYERLYDPKHHHSVWGSDGLLLQLHAWEVDHHHGPMGDPALPRGNGVLVWFALLYVNAPYVYFTLLVSAPVVLIVLLAKTSGELVLALKLTSLAALLTGLGLAAAIAF